VATVSDTTPAVPLNIANTLSAARICAVPFQLHFAFSGQKTAFLVLLMLVLLSDAIDGFIARKMGQESEIGSRMDSLGDFATYVSLPICMWGLWPELIREETAFLLLAGLSTLLPALVGYCRFRRPIAFHTWSAKLSAVLLGVTLLLMMILDMRWPFRVVTPIICLAGLETLAVTLVLPRYRANVSSLIHALAIRRDGEANTA